MSTRVESVGAMPSADVELAEPSGPQAPPSKSAELQQEELHVVKDRRFVWLFLWACAGVFQGFIYTKCLIPHPKVLVDQFIFRNCIVLKMFMSAVGFSMLTQSAMARLVPEEFFVSRFYGQKKFGYGRVAFGAGVLGMGMAISGSGPTMVAPAIGGHVETAWCLAVGGLIGAIIIGVADKVCERYNVGSFSGQPQEGSLTVEALIERLTHKSTSYQSLSLGIGTFLVLATVALEIIWNFQDDAFKYGGVLAQTYPSSILDYPAWPPILAGFAAGVGQVPLRMLTADGAGGATSFVVVASTLSYGKLSPQASLFKSLSNGWQITYNFLLVLSGALLTRVLNSNWALDETNQPLTEGFSPLRMMVGSCIGILGARIAGGCTCGHGVSGTSELSVESFVAAGAIFGSAIVMRCILVLGFDVVY